MKKRSNIFNQAVFTTICCLALLLITSSCGTHKQAVNTKSPEAKVTTSENEDSTQYELLVFDPGFDSFLARLGYPKEFYSDAYYRGWNIRYVQEWNYRCKNPLRYGSFYDTEIPYDAHTDYGLDFNYRLYHYFMFVEQQYGVVLVPRKGK